MEPSIEIANIVPVAFIIAVLIISIGVIVWYTITQVLNQVPSGLANTTGFQRDVEKGAIPEGKPP